VKTKSLISLTYDLDSPTKLKLRRCLPILVVENQTSSTSKYTLKLPILVVENQTSCTSKYTLKLNYSGKNAREKSHVNQNA
jgi:hypothetical protein